MGKPVKVGVKVREMLRGVFQRQYDAGVRFRTREKRLEDILSMVRQEYPEATMEQLVGDELEFLKAERSDDECGFFREQSSCPWDCGNLGKLWIVVRKETRSGPVYSVGYQMCGKYLAWQEKKRLEQEKREQPSEGTFVAAFSTKLGGRKYETNDG